MLSSLLKRLLRDHRLVCVDLREESAEPEEDNFSPET
jgi:hypothetical protein